MENQANSKAKSHIQNKRRHILIAYLTQGVIIAITYFAECSRYILYDQTVNAAAVIAVLYLIYWIITARKSYMPWAVYLNFLVGCAAEFFLNWTGIIYGDRGEMFFGGLLQFFYIFFIGAKAAIVLICNVVMQWLFIRRLRKPNLPYRPEEF